MQRRGCEITLEGKVMVENISGHPFAFSILPNKNEGTFLLEAYNMQQRVCLVITYIAFIITYRINGFVSLP